MIQFVLQIDYCNVQWLENMAFISFFTLRVKERNTFTYMFQGSNLDSLLFSSSTIYNIYQFAKSSAAIKDYEKYAYIL